MPVKGGGEAGSSDNGRTFESSVVKRQKWQLASVGLGLAKSSSTSGWTLDGDTRAEFIIVMVLESDSLLAS